MRLNTLGKNEMYLSVADILGIDMEVVKRFVKENADEIVDYYDDEHSIEQMNLDSLINGNRMCRKRK